MSFYRSFLATALIAALAVGTAQAEVLNSYSGKLSSDGTEDGLIVDNFDWATGETPLTLEWEVSQETIGGLWTYEYTLTVPGKPNVSHIIIEASLTFEDENIFGWNPDAFGSSPIDGVSILNGEIQSAGVGDFNTSNGNPGIPIGEDDPPLHGIKFDGTQGYGETNSGDPEDLEGDSPWILSFAFSTYRDPVWGDFYAKGGKDKGIWNAGFTFDDPLDDATDGSLANHLLVPDSTGDHFENPEPATVVIFSILASLGAMWISRRRHAGR